MVLQLHCLPAIHAPWCYTVRHAAPSVSGWSTNSYLHIFPQGKDLAMRLFAWLRPFSDPTYPRSWDFIRPRVAALPSQPLPTRRTWFTLSSFRSNVHQLRRLLLMVACQRLQGPAEPFSLRCVVEMPLGACYLPALLLVGANALPPQFAFLIRVFLLTAPLNQPV